MGYNDRSIFGKYLIQEENQPLLPTYTFLQGNAILFSPTGSRDWTMPRLWRA